MTPALPSHRQLLTSLFTSLCHNTHIQSEGGSQSPQPAPCNTRVGNSLLCDRRCLFLTLHAIFPDTVLPALDLIDRRLVVRVIATKNLAKQGERATTGLDRKGNPPKRFTQSSGIKTRIGAYIDCGGFLDHRESTNADMTSLQHFFSVTDTNDSSAAIYLVHSRASNKTYRVAHGSTQTPKSYLVQLDAWHCSCPSFAMDTFTGRSSPLSSSTESQTQRDNHSGWSGSFSRMSHDGLGNLGESAPCCRHLLACLLSDTWDLIMGHAHVWRYTNEEIAGLVLCAQ